LESRFQALKGSHKTIARPNIDVAIANTEHLKLRKEELKIVGDKTEVSIKHHPQHISSEVHSTKGSDNHS